MWPFTRKKSPLSSTSYTPLNSVNTTLNPMHNDEREILASDYIRKYKKHDTSIFKKEIPALRNYVKKYPSFVNSRFNRSQSDLSNVSEEDFTNMKYQLVRTNGGKRKTRKMRKSRKSRR